MKIEDLEDLIRERRSIRKWKSKEVADDLLRRAILSATWAPNGGNYQGWYFIVVKNPFMIQSMADAVQGIVNKMSSWPEAEPWMEDLSHSSRTAGSFRHAPVCIAVFVKKYRSWIDDILSSRLEADEDAKRITIYRQSAPTAIQSASAAVTNMLLAFHAMGLGAVWLAGPLIAKKEIEKTLQVPDHMSLMCMVAVGYPDESPRSERRPLNEVMRIIH